ncbi:MAG: phosphoribosyl-AMP cyclohydrolase [Pseudomonadota bacterium]
MTATDETTDFRPKFDAKGLMPAITIEEETGEVLMLAYVNKEALEKTLETGEMHYWSRSRSELWHKGATSGNIQKVTRLEIDCDQDTLLARVHQQGPACHTGRKSCFYRELKVNESAQPLTSSVQLTFTTN